MEIEIYKTFTVKLSEIEAFALRSVLETCIKCKVTNKYHTETLETLHEQLVYSTEGTEKCKA